MKIISITHASDIDGLGSSALIKMKYRIPSSDIFFSDYSAEGLIYIEKKLERIIQKERRVTLFLTDHGMNKGLVGIFTRIIGMIKRNGGKVIWFDHHVWSEAELEDVASLCDLAIVGENHKSCATEITQKMLRVDTKFAKKFTELVHYSDFNLRPKSKELRKLIGIYAMSITYYNTLRPYEKRDRALRHVVDLLASSRFNDASMRKAAADFERRNKQRIALMLKKLYKIGRSAYLGFSDTLQSSQGCTAIMEKMRCDVGVYVNLNAGKTHFRSKELDCTLICNALGGGGHPHAAGFNVDMKRFRNLKKENERKLFAEFLGEEMERLY